jgi:glycosyltransferase involved in cell wall biosynthesis
MEGEIEKPNENQYKISVILCTYKRSDKFINALYSVINQTFPSEDYEIIVVNNDYKSDAVWETVGDIKKRTNNKYSITCITAPLKGLSFARNAGMMQASGEVLLYLDDDAIADQTLLEETYAGFVQHPEAGVIGGSIFLSIPNQRPDVLLPGMEVLWSQLVIDGDHYRESTHQGEFPYGANFGVRRDSLMRIGGFRTAYGRKGNDYAGGEEMVVSYMMREIGMKVGLNPKSKVLHDVDVSRYSREHVQKTIRASLFTTYQLQKDLYAPMESSIDYDLGRIMDLELELEVLNSKNGNGQNEMEIFYKQCYLEAFRDLIKLKQHDEEQRISFFTDRNSLGVG